MITLAQFILESKDEYNQHKQFTFGKLPLSQGLQLCKEFEEYTEEKYSFVCEVYTEGSYSIIQKDFWSTNEHKDGHTDRLILSVDDGGED